VAASKSHHCANTNVGGKPRRDTKMTITVDENRYAFSMSSDEQSWTGVVLVKGREIEIEIDKRTYKQENIDWDNLRDFIIFINKSDLISDLIDESFIPLNAFAKAFWRRDKGGVKDYEMRFTGLYFHGISMLGDFHHYNFSLIFNFLTTRDNEIFGDEYGLYLVDIEHLDIVGIRRIQL
jgi:hypothetical protein